MKNYRLHLIRHGASEDNINGLLGGFGRDAALSKEGIAQLTAMKEQFQYPQIEALFVSPLKRAVETATLLYPEKERILIAPLVEVHYGAFEGKPLREIYENNFFPAWMQEEKPVTPEGAEVYAEFKARAAAGVATLLEGMMKSGIYEAAAITHGGVIAAVLSTYGLPEQPENMWYADNGAGFTMSTSPAMWMRSNKAEVVAIQPAGYLEALNNE